MNRVDFLPGMLILLFFYACSTIHKGPAPPMAQAPSPMEEHIRAHKRISDTAYAGQKIMLEGVLSKPITLYIPLEAEDHQAPDVLLHFHGTANVPIQAVEQMGKPILLAVVNQGSGSSVYQNAFEDSTVFSQLIDSIKEKSKKNSISKLYCSAFSAGYGAVRELLKIHAEHIDGVLLLDGLHTDYIPDAAPLDDGGKLNTEKLVVFSRYALKAMEGKKKLLITHSEIFPGTYASTTETTQWLLDTLGLKRKPILAWGPLGMQQLAQTTSGKLRVMGFAGNSAPDHVDHFHGIGTFLQYFWQD